MLRVCYCKSGISKIPFQSLSIIQRKPLLEIRKTNGLPPSRLQNHLIMLQIGCYNHRYLRFQFQESPSNDLFHQKVHGFIFLLLKAIMSALRDSYFTGCAVLPELHRPIRVQILLFLSSILITENTAGTKASVIVDIAPDRPVLPEKIHPDQISVFSKEQLCVSIPPQKTNHCKRCVAPDQISRPLQTLPRNHSELLKVNPLHLIEKIPDIHGIQILSVKEHAKSRRIGQNH